MIERWANKFDECVVCGSSDRPHKSRGMCTTCYYRSYKRPKPAKRTTDYDRGIVIGTDIGRYEIIDALDRLLERLGSSCRFEKDTLAIRFQDKWYKEKI